MVSFSFLWNLEFCMGLKNNQKLWGSTFAMQTL